MENENQIVESEEKAVTVPENKCSYSEKIQLAVACFGFVVSVIALLISFFSLKIANKTYDYSSTEYSMVPEVTKNGDILTIKNPDVDIFEITDICVQEFEFWRIRGAERTKSVLLEKLFYHRNIKDDDKPNIDITNVDLNVVLQENGEKMSSIHQQKFNDAYNYSIANLQSQRKMDFKEKCYDIFIEYVNKKSYETKIVELNISLDEENNLDTRVPYLLTGEYDAFCLVSNNDFSGTWQELIEYLDHVEKRGLTISTE